MTVLHRTIPVKVVSNFAKWPSTEEYEVSASTSARDLIEAVLHKHGMMSRDPNLFYFELEGTVLEPKSNKEKSISQDCRPLTVQAANPNCTFALHMRSGGLIKIYDSCLMPGSYYKSLFISKTTTSRETIGLLLNSYGIKESPENFSLVEQTSKGKEIATLKSYDYPLLRDQSKKSIEIHLKRIEEGHRKQPSSTPKDTSRLRDSFRWLQKIRGNSDRENEERSDSKDAEDSKRHSDSHQGLSKELSLDFLRPRNIKDEDTVSAHSIHFPIDRSTGTGSLSARTTREAHGPPELQVYLRRGDPASEKDSSSGDAKNPRTYQRGSLSAREYPKVVPRLQVLPELSGTESTDLDKRLDSNRYDYSSTASQIPPRNDPVVPSSAFTRASKVTSSHRYPRTEARDVTVPSNESGFTRGRSLRVTSAGRPVVPGVGDDRDFADRLLTRLRHERELRQKETAERTARLNAYDSTRECSQSPSSPGQHTPSSPKKQVDSKEPITSQHSSNQSQTNLTPKTSSRNMSNSPSKTSQTSPTRTNGKMSPKSQKKGSPVTSPKRQLPNVTRNSPETFQNTASASKQHSTLPQSPKSGAKNGGQHSSYRKYQSDQEGGSVASHHPSAKRSPPTPRTAVGRYSDRQGDLTDRSRTSGYESMAPDSSRSLDENGRLVVTDDFTQVSSLQANDVTENTLGISTTSNVSSSSRETIAEANSFREKGFASSSVLTSPRSSPHRTPANLYPRQSDMRSRPVQCNQTNQTDEGTLQPVAKVRRTQAYPSLYEITRLCNTFSVHLTRFSKWESIGLRCYESLFLTGSDDISTPNGRRPAIGKRRGGAFDQINPERLRYQKSVICVESIAERSVASVEGSLRAGDVLLEINGVSVLPYSPEQVDLLLSSYTTLEVVAARSKANVNTRNNGIVSGRANDTTCSESSDLRAMREQLEQLKMDAQRKNGIIEELKGVIARKVRVRHVEEGYPLSTRILDKTSFRPIPHTEDALARI